jgi:hypothetical protein
MRTTVELPPELMRAAKARAADSGESLKALFARAVAAELQMPAGRSASKGRVRLPLFGDPAGPSIPVTNADLERALAATEIVSTSPRRPPRGRNRR